MKLNWLAILKGDLKKFQFTILLPFDNRQLLTSLHVKQLICSERHETKICFPLRPPLTNTFDAILRNNGYLTVQEI